MLSSLPLRYLASLAFAGMIILPTVGCFGPGQFSEDEPFALQIREFRSFLHARQLQSRLKGMGIKTYIVRAGTQEEGGSWFKVLYGAEEESGAIRELLKKLAEKHTIDDINIVNHAELLDSLTLDPDPKIYAEPKVAGNRPAVPEVLWDTMARYPLSNLFNIESMAILATPPDPDTGARYLRTHGDTKLDLPRGISKKHLRDSCDSISEVVLRDNLFNDQVTINILKMRLNHEISGGVASHFADLVLDTGAYSTEEKLPFKVKAKEKLSGYKVVIEPRSNYFRTYIILTDPSEEWVYFSQSTKKSPEEMVTVLKLIGKSDGMLEYPEFYNTFHAVPDRLMPEDIFAGFKLSRIGNNYARSRNNAQWARAVVGHWSAHGLFNHEARGTYSFGVYDLMSPDKVSWVHAGYARKNSGLAQVEVYGTQGYAPTKQRWSKRRRQYSTMTTEVNWTENRYIVMINNTEKSWLSRDDLIRRGNALQLNRAGAYSWETGEDNPN